MQKHSDEYGQLELRDRLYIGGEWSNGADDATFVTRNPATDEAVATVAQAGQRDAERGLTAARDAFESQAWGGLSSAERGRYLAAMADYIRNHEEELAQVESLDVGRPIGEARGVVQSAADHLEYYAGLTDKIQGDSIDVPGNRFDFTRREPYGVSVHIVPWNAPFSLAFRDVAPALASGNTVVVKPSMEAPLSNLLLGEIAEAVDLPPGVVNVLPGPGEPTGEALVTHPDTGRTTFTGSVATGKEIMRLSAEHLQPMNLELGGKSPNIVFPDANLDAAIDGAIRGIFRNAGQMCVAGSRLFVHDDIYDEFVDRLVAETERLQLGPGRDEETDVGPVITAEAQQDILEYVDSGQREGATLVTGGDAQADPSLADGYFVEPTIFTDVDDDMTIACEEIFGPVLSVFRFSNRDEVVERANDTEFGLYAGIWTNELERAHDVAAAIEAGYVSVNEYPVLFPSTPFGGYKQSGYGRERGIQALSHYTRLKNVLMNFDNV